MARELATRGGVAITAMVVTLLAVWWYVPPLSQIIDRRAERNQLEALNCAADDARGENQSIQLRGKGAAVRGGR